MISARNEAKGEGMSASLPGASGSGAGAARNVIKKSMWTKEEDRDLREQVRLHGTQNWDAVCLVLPGRNAKSCRLRWCQHLDPKVDAVRVRPFSLDEDMLIVHYHAVHGNRWSTIAGYLQGRTDNAVKNRWNSVLRDRYAPYEKRHQPPPGPCPVPGQAAAAELTPGCLPLFPLVSGDVRRHGAGPVMPLAPGEDAAAGVEEGGAAAGCGLELFPQAPGDVRGNASAAAMKNMSCGAGDPLTELRLWPAAAAAASVVYDAVPLQANRM